MLYDLSGIHWFLRIDIYTVLLILIKLSGVSKMTHQVKNQKPSPEIPPREYACSFGLSIANKLARAFVAESALMPTSAKEFFKRPTSNRLCVSLKCVLASAYLLEVLGITENMTVEFVF